MTLNPSNDKEDFLVRTGRVLLYAGIFFSSLISIRVGGTLTLGDLLLLPGIVLVGVGALVGSNHRGLPSMRKVSGGVGIALLLLILGAALSTIRATDEIESLSVMLRLVLVIFILPAALRSALTTRVYFRRAVTAFAIGAAVCGAGTVLQYFGGPTVIPGGIVTNAGRFSGFAQSVSDTGAITSLGVITSIALFSEYAGRRRLGALALLAASAIGLFLSGSVSGLIAVVVGCFVLLFRRVLKLRHVVLIALASGVILQFVVGVQSKSNALDPITRVLQTLGLGGNVSYNTSGSRISTYKAALDGFLDNPIVGSGLDYESTVADGFFPAHNLFLAAAFGGGVFLLLAIILVVLRPFRGKWINSDRSFDASVALTMTFSALSFAMTAPSLFNRYLWIPVALLLVARHLSSKREREGVSNISAERETAAGNQPPVSPVLRSTFR